LPGKFPAKTSLVFCLRGNFAGVNLKLGLPSEIKKQRFKALASPFAHLYQNALNE
jgi:hypothetical protein